MGLTIVEFRNRFTQAEKIAIDLAAIDNPSAPIESGWSVQCACGGQTDAGIQANGAG